MRIAYLVDASGSLLDPLLSRIGKVVADRRLRINTVQFFYEEPQGVLEAIARRHGGNYQFISPPKARPGLVRSRPNRTCPRPPDPDPAS